MKYDSPAVYNSINEYAKMHETCPPDFSYLDRKASVIIFLNFFSFIHILFIIFTTILV